MATKIRLQRNGKKGKPFYHVVIADSRAKRDGKFIEKVGTYNPNTNPATIDLKFDRALHWISTGAQPTDTVRALLSYKGVMYKNHLNKGVLKGAFTQEDADKKFETWLISKESKITAKSDKIKSEIEAKIEEKLIVEREISEARSKVIAEKNIPEEVVENNEIEEVVENNEIEEKPEIDENSEKEKSIEE